MTAVFRFRFPAKFAGARIEADHVAIRSGVDDDVVIDGEVLGSGGGGDVGGNLAFVFP